MVSPPEFSGGEYENVVSFLQRLDTYFILKNIDDGRRIAVLGACLFGVARTAYDSVANTFAAYLHGRPVPYGTPGSNIATYEDRKIWLREYFFSPSRIQRLQDDAGALKMRPGESPRGFASR